MQTASHSDPRSLKGLGRDTMIYGLGTILGRVASFFMLPVYTRFLTPADYGILQILDLTLEIAALVVSAGATAGLARFYFKAETVEGKNQVLFTGYLTQVALNLIGAVLLLAAAPLIWRTVLSESGSVLMVQVASINFVTGVLSAVPVAMFRLDQRPVAAVTISICRLVLVLSLNILFVVGLEWGPLGMLVSTLVTNVLLGLVMSTILLRRTGLAFKWTVFRDFRRFAIPMQLSAAGGFIIQFGDRFFIEAHHGVAAVGLYGIAYQFGFMLSGLIAHPFGNAWRPRAYQLVNHPREVRDRAYNRALIVLDLFLVTAAVVVAAFIRPILIIMTTPQFYAAAPLVPVLLVGTIFHNWVGNVVFGITVSERTRYVAIYNWITVALVLVLYAVLIPPYGAMGAAVATLISMAVKAGLAYWFSQRLWPISYEWHRHLLLLSAAVVTMAAVFVLDPAGLVTQLVTGTVATLAYGTFVWFVVLRPEERSMFRTLATDPRQIWNMLVPRESR